MSEFDIAAMYAAMDLQRMQKGLGWRQVADELWAQSNILNERRNDHPISASTLTGIAKRGDCTCQHALFILRWLGRSPESFLSGPSPGTVAVELPLAGPERRLRWDLKTVAAALDARRRERGLTWKQLAKELHCTEHQLTGIRTAKFAIGMKLIMRIVQWLDRPSSAFITAAHW